MSEHVTEKVYNVNGTHVWMHNPETGGTWECPVDYASIAESRGWIYAAPSDSSNDGLFDAADPSAAVAPIATQQASAVLTDFDPAEHTVPEVNAHLEEYADNAPEVERVLELERAAEAPRSTVNGI